jgi:hypothetical protein
VNNTYKLNTALNAMNVIERFGRKTHSSSTCNPSIILNAMNVIERFGRKTHSSSTCNPSIVLNAMNVIERSGRKMRWSSTCNPSTTNASVIGPDAPGNFTHWTRQISTDKLSITLALAVNGAIASCSQKLLLNSITRVNIISRVINVV